MSVDNELKFTEFEGFSPTLVQENNCPIAIDMNSKGDARDELYLNIHVLVAPLSGGAATVKVKLKSDTTSAFSSETTAYDSGAVAISALTIGRIISVRVPKGVEKHLRASLTIAVAALTAGTFALYLSDHPENNVRNVSI